MVNPSRDAGVNSGMSRSAATSHHGFWRFTTHHAGACTFVCVYVWTVWYGIVWCGIVCDGMAQYNVVGCGMVG